MGTRNGFESCDSSHRALQPSELDELLSGFPTSGGRSPVSLFSTKTLLVATHVATFGVAFTATILVMARSNDATSQFFALLRYFPQSKAASLSYEWGTQADAREMMSRYIAKAEPQATNTDSIAQLDLDAAKVRLAMLNG